MLTMNCFIERKYHLDTVISEEDKELLRKENEGKNPSYVALMNEMLHYKGRTVRELLGGWGGVMLFSV